MLARLQRLAFVIAVTILLLGRMARMRPLHRQGDRIGPLLGPFRVRFSGPGQFFGHRRPRPQITPQNCCYRGPALWSTALV
jgi:hypothetical protein